MKNIIRNTIAALILIFALSACYDDYKVDFEHTATYFALQSPLRTVLLQDGEECSFEIAAMLGGRYRYDNAEFVEFEIDPTMLDDTSTNLVLLPESYYELSNNSEMSSKSGETLARTTLTIKDAFYDDQSSHLLHYALPIRIVSSSLDSILPEKDRTIIAVKYENKYYGAYRVKGVDYTLDVSGNITSKFPYSVSDFSQNIYTTTGTLAKDTCTLPYMGSDLTGFNSMKLTISDNGNVSVSSFVADSSVVISGNGSYNGEDRIFYLDYSYEKEGEKHQVYDTLYHFAVPMEVQTWR